MSDTSNCKTGPQSEPRLWIQIANETESERMPAALYILVETTDGSPFRLTTGPVQQVNFRVFVHGPGDSLSLRCIVQALRPFVAQITEIIVFGGTGGESSIKVLLQEPRSIGLSDLSLRISEQMQANGLPVPEFELP